MTSLSGPPPVATQAAERSHAPAPLHARQAETARGLTPSAGDVPVTSAAVQAVVGADAADTVARRRLAQAYLPPDYALPDPEAPTGPPPAFATTPLETLRPPPSALLEILSDGDTAHAQLPRALPYGDPATGPAGDAAAPPALDLKR